MENKRTYRIAVVDDDVIIRTLIGTLFLEVDVFEMAYFGSGESFIESFSKVEYDAIILDHDFASENAGNLSGSDILRMVRSQNYKVPVIMMSGQEDMEIALDLVELNVSDYIEKKDLYFDRLYDSLSDVVEYSAVKSDLNKTSGSLRKMSVRTNVFISIASLCALVFVFSKIF